MESIIEYPKALYQSADQEGPYLVAADAKQEEELRGQGFKPLSEWWAEPKPAEPKPAKAAKASE